LPTWPTQAKAALEAEKNLEAFADRGYSKGEEILSCEKPGIYGHSGQIPRQIVGEVGRDRFWQAGFPLILAEETILRLSSR